MNHLKWLLMLSDSFDINGSFSVSEKVDFISEFVYNDNRNFETWIGIEAKVNKKFDNHKLQWDHNLWHKNDYQRISKAKSVFLDTKPKWCIKHLFPLKSYLEGISPSSFVHDCHIHSKYIKTHLPNCFVVDPSFLDEQILPVGYFNKLEQYLDIQIPYNEAKLVHKLWYNCRIRAREDFLKTVSILYEREKTNE